MIWPHVTYRFSAPVVKGKERPRHGNGNVWTPEATEDAQRLIAQEYVAATSRAGARRKAPAGVPVKITVRIRRRLSAKAAKRRDVVAEVDQRKPDVDNVLKTVMDALEGVAYEDDRQVVDARALREVATRREREEVAIEVTFPRTWDEGWNQIREPEV